MRPSDAFKALPRGERIAKLSQLDLPTLEANRSTMQQAREVAKATLDDAEQWLADLDAAIAWVNA